MKQFVYITLISIIFIIFTITNPAIAVENDLHMWNSAYITLPINDRFEINVEETTRFGGKITHLNQNVLRPILIYQLTKDFSIGQGYAWNPGLFPKYNNEQHIWQQAMWKHQFSKLVVTARFRLQERLLQGVDGASVRSRYFIRFMYPLDKKKIWSLVAQTEPFVTFNSRPHGPKAGLDRINSFFGINKKISENVNLDLGYQLQYVNSISPIEDHLNHTILTALYFDLPPIFKRRDN